MVNPVRRLRGLGLLIVFSLPLSASAENVGLNLFEGKCGSCHVQGGSAAVLKADDKAMRQWERFFKRERHQKTVDISGVLTPAELDQVLEYLMANSADSDKEIAAGLR